MGLRARLGCGPFGGGPIGLLDGCESYTEDQNGDLAAILEQLSAHIHQSSTATSRSCSDLRAFVGDCLYLIKPMQLRFWLRSRTLADADEIALDLQQAVTPQRCRAAN